jgi:hypothetical protein
MSKTEKDNLYIKEIIQQNKPFFIGRIAGCELQVAQKCYNKNLSDLVYDLKELENNAGIKIMNNESLNMYVEKLISAYDNCTIIAEWDQNGEVFAHTGKGQQIIQNRTPNTPKIDAIALEPYYFKDSWMRELKGKKILIVHPFIKTISKQIHNLATLFPNREWFEDCTFQVIAPPLTLAGNHQNKDWQEHFNSFLEKLKDIADFDIALVAAGGYGMLIADYIYKEKGKSVIYIGGALQIFFGIIGKRWFENKDILKLVNDDWIRPDKLDKPQNYTNVEKGCYW